MKDSSEFACLYGPPPVDYRRWEIDEKEKQTEANRKKNKKNVLNKIMDFFRNKAKGQDESGKNE